MSGIENPEARSETNEVDGSDQGKMEKAGENDSFLEKVVGKLAGRDSMMYKMMKGDIDGLKSERIVNDETHDKIDARNKALDEAAGN